MRSTAVSRFIFHRRCSNPFPLCRVIFCRGHSDQGDEVEALERQFLSLMDDFGSGFGDDIRRTIAVLSFLLSCFSYFEKAEDVKSRTNSELAKVAPILSYIQEHLSDPLTTQSIADAFFMSKYHLCHIFKEGTGFRVIDYVINCRILKARMLLREGMRVQEAGERVGFRSNEHFIRTFKRLTGVPPKRYAMRYRESDQKMNPEIVVVEGRDGRQVESLKA